MSEQQSGNPMVSRVVEIDLKIPRVIINWSVTDLTGC
jgi:hypothetical protein